MELKEYRIPVTLNVAAASEDEAEKKAREFIEKGMGDSVDVRGWADADADENVGASGWR